MGPMTARRVPPLPLRSAPVTGGARRKLQGGPPTVIAKCTTAGQPVPMGARESRGIGGAQGRAGCHMDLLFVAATILFFAVSLAYVRGCDRL